MTKKKPTKPSPLQFSVPAANVLGVIGGG